MVVTNFLDVDVKKTRRQRRVRINTTRTNPKKNKKRPDVNGSDDRPNKPNK